MIHLAILHAINTGDCNYGQRFEERRCCRLANAKCGLISEPHGVPTTLKTVLPSLSTHTHLSLDPD